MTKLFDPTRFPNMKRFSNKKECCSCEIAATHAGFGHVQVGMATKIFVLILHVTGDQCQL